MFIDVACGTILTREELRDYAAMGLVVCGGVNISHILEYVTEDMYTENEVEALTNKAYDEGWDNGNGD